MLKFSKQKPSHKNSFLWNLTGRTIYCDPSLFGFINRGLKFEWVLILFSLPVKHTRWEVPSYKGQNKIYKSKRVQWFKNQPIRILHTFYLYHALIDPMNKGSCKRKHQDHLCSLSLRILPEGSKSIHHQFYPHFMRSWWLINNPKQELGTIK